MGYRKQNGRWADTLDMTVLTSGTRTTTGSGVVVETGDRGTLRLTLTVTAASGTSPTLDVSIETSHDGTTWRSLGAFAQKTTVVTERKSFTGADRFVRATYTIGGTTPSLTFAVTGECV